MKKTINTSVLGISFLAVNAQVQVTSKNFDLESQNKHKNWQFGEAGIDSQTGNVFIKLKQPECDKSETFWTLESKISFHRGSRLLDLVNYIAKGKQDEPK